jgi:hypothetical protein
MKYQVKSTISRLLYLNTQTIEILPFEIINFVYNCLEISVCIIVILKKRSEQLFDQTVTKVQ